MHTQESEWIYRNCILTAMRDVKQNEKISDQKNTKNY